MPNVILPGDNEVITVCIEAPVTPGDCVIRLVPIQQAVRWFEPSNPALSVDFRIHVAPPQ